MRDEKSDGLRPSAQLVGRRQDWTASHPLRWPDNKLIRVPNLEYYRTQEEVRDSTQDILDEMRSIRCIEHNGRAKFIPRLSVSRRISSARPSALTSLKVA